MSSPLPVYLTAAEVADILRVKPWEVSKLCKDGEIQAVKPGLRWLITPADVAAYIERKDSERKATEQGAA